MRRSVNSCRCWADWVGLLLIGRYGGGSFELVRVRVSDCVGVSDVGSKQLRPIRSVDCHVNQARISGCRSCCFVIQNGEQGRFVTSIFESAHSHQSAGTVAPDIETSVVCDRCHRDVTLSLACRGHGLDPR